MVQEVSVVLSNYYEITRLKHILKEHKIETNDFVLVFVIYICE